MAALNDSEKSGISCVLCIKYSLKIQLLLETLVIDRGKLQRHRGQVKSTEPIP
jgi:hypothetical protein